MKEVTKWNGKPRWMLCWDTENGTKVTEFVLCILTEEEMDKADTDYPVRALKGFFKHCAEIEEDKEQKNERSDRMERKTTLHVVLGL